MLTHAAVAASALATSERLGIDPARDRWLACLPLAHVGGLSVVTRALATGTPLTVHERFDAGAVAAAAAAGCTRTSLVPTALARVDPAAFRTILVGGQAPPGDRPANVIATYGMTETGSGIAYDGVPLDGVEVRIADDGEVQLRAPMLLRAYRDGTDPRTPDGWFPTGDLGRVDGDGVLAVHGRRGDLIITGGENVWPASVEPVLARHPAVAEVAVVGRADPEWGQRVVAVVVPQDPVQPPSPRRAPSVGQGRAARLRRAHRAGVGRRAPPHGQRQGPAPGPPDLLRNGGQPVRSRAMTDPWTWVATERRSTADLFEGLDAGQLATPSLCEGWTVKHVLAHLTMQLDYAPTEFLPASCGRGSGSRRPSLL